MNIFALRSQFPYLETGLIYLNHAATSPWSSAVERKMQEIQNEFVRGEVEAFPQAMRTIDEARSMAAEMIGCETARVAFVQNTSEGLNVLASGLDWKSGDRIVIPDREFPANVYPFLNLADRGVELDFVPQREGEVRLEDIERAIGPRTRLVAASWVQFLSGFALDLASLSELCRRKGVLLSVDGIQGIGALRLNLANTPVDFLSAGVQKWQMGPQGVGIIYVAERTQELIRQAHLGWLSVPHAWDFFAYRVELRDDARRYENGTYNTAGIYGYHGALSLFRDTGFDEAAGLVRANADCAWSLAADAGYELITPADPARRAGIVTFRHDRAEEAAGAMRKRGIIVSARSGHIRISPHFYNTREELEAAFEALRDFLER
jgi:selenocysteine lyase/cysteine desulfurase